MRLLFILRTIHRDYGGPLEGTRELSSELTRLGHKVEIAHMDAPGTEGESYFNVPLHALGPSWGAYGYSSRLVPWMRRHALEYDAVIVNGLWHYPGVGVSRALRGTGVPYFVFTHGSLHPWFRGASRSGEWKRILYWKAFESRVLLRAHAILFTSEEERELSRVSYTPFPNDLRVTSYCAAEPPEDLTILKLRFLARFPVLQGRRIVLFLGRIHAVKGCDLLVEAFARVSAAHPDLTLVIAGPDPMKLVARLKKQSEDLGVGARVLFTGSLYGDDKWGALAAAEIFVSPSHAECFGVSLAAALAVGNPVGISYRVNTWRAITDNGAGFVNQDTVEGTLDILSQWLSTDPSRLDTMALSAKALFKSRYSPSASAPRFLAALGINLVLTQTNIPQ